MSYFDCPACGQEYDCGNYPDLYTDLGSNNKTSFDCECGCTFEMWVDFEPVFTVDRFTQLTYKKSEVSSCRYTALQFDPSR